ncbi:intradiol ring-cleavage dioxygenase [Rhodocytophaga rosea]|uniref:Intradiol ring-cleavage dioxygenase n=1 Tax=Rhodocytophaga rosea TaxID=2704465 RepID=A0A6C0GRK0_9BACT|nr:intradiol ring-cleavage dioxygenase [Rhodocytophaga rosea]QHT70223.1 intradiol ring-cleavage dioxygenase [Rhodocytophaga rosea]
MKTKRRQFLSLLSALPILGFLPARMKEPRLPLTPACDDGDEPTPSQTEGPYFKTESPERSILLEKGMAGTTLVLKGQVLNTRCQPVARALLDWWHCDDAGNYDNSGYTLRGHQYTDAQGKFQLETIVPGIYTGRTRHIHVKVQAPGKSVLTTQLYFPDESKNGRDRIFNKALLIEMRKEKEANAVLGGYNFVVKA